MRCDNSFSLFAVPLPCFFRKSEIISLIHTKKKTFRNVIASKANNAGRQHFLCLPLIDVVVVVALSEARIFHRFADSHVVCLCVLLAAI